MKQKLYICVEENGKRNFLLFRKKRNTFKWKKFIHITIQLQLTRWAIWGHQRQMIAAGTESLCINLKFDKIISKKIV